MGGWNSRYSVLVGSGPFVRPALGGVQRSGGETVEEEAFWRCDFEKGRKREASC